MLGQSSSTWQEKKVPSPYEQSPDLTVYINIGSDHKVNFYESEPELAMVTFEGKYRYYKIPEDTYEQIYMMCAKSSYLTPEAVINAVAGSKKTKLKSVQDTPNHDYQTLEIGDEVYYIYGKGDKYYIEKPYQFIGEIDEGAYKDIMEFIILSIDEESFLKLAKNEWKYAVEIADKPLPTNGEIEIKKHDFKIVYSARNSLFASIQEEVFLKGQISGEYRDHLAIVG